MKSIRAVFVILLLSSAAVFAQAKVSTCVPPSLFLETSGKEANLIVRGQGLDELQSFAILREGKPWKPSMVQVREKSATKIILILSLAPTEKNLGEGYQLVARRADGTAFVFPVKIEGVSSGDARAQQPSLDDMLKSSSQRVLTVDAETVPRIWETQPSPLLIKADGQSQQVILKGANLSRVTQIRVRKAEKRSYQPGRGVIPFEFTAHGLKLELMASVDTPIGTKYAMDILMGKYLVTSIPFEVVSP